MDLIRQVKAVTRADAGLSDYDPTGDVPPLPLLSEAVAALDPSPPYLRCKSCKGKLLRGVQSVICIYCGRPNDVPPDPISFKDTLACRWLLESLHLDGSEMVGQATKRSEFNREQDTPKGHIPLSDFLNLKITWRSEVEKKEITLNKQTQGRNSLNLTGADLDNFFSAPQISVAPDIPEEHSFQHKDIEATEYKEPSTHNNLSFFENMQPSNQSSEREEGAGVAEAKEVESHDDPSFFQNVKPVELAAHSSKDKDDDAFSGWEPSFQSADSGNQLDSSKTFDPFISSEVQHETPKSSDPFGGSVVDLSSMLDSVFGPGTDSKDGKTQVGTAASTSMDDWNDDLWNNMSSNLSQQTGQTDLPVGVKNVVSEDARDSDWFDVGQWQSNNVNAPDNTIWRDDDDSFADWNDFASSTSVNVSSENSATQSHTQPTVAAGEKSNLNLLSTDNKFKEIDVGSFSQADPSPSLFSRENVSAALTASGLEVSSSERVVDSDSYTGGEGGGEQPARGEDFKTAGSEEAERILSQIRDLSFMLEDNLSLPSKPNNLHS